MRHTTQGERTLFQNFRVRGHALEGQHIEGRQQEGRPSQRLWQQRIESQGGLMQCIGLLHGRGNHNQRTTQAPRQQERIERFGGGIQPRKAKRTRLRPIHCRREPGNRRRKAWLRGQ